MKLTCFSHLPSERLNREQTERRKQLLKNGKKSKKSSPLANELSPIGKLNINSEIIEKQSRKLFSKTSPSTSDTNNWFDALVNIDSESCDHTDSVAKREISWRLR